MKRMQWCLLTLVITLLAAGCKRAAPPAPAEPATSVKEPPASPSGTPSEAVAPTGAADSPSTGAAATDFHRVYRGTIEPNLVVFLRLSRTGARLSGRYFYESQGRDLKLDGEVAADGAFSLRESSQGKASGSFRGRMDSDGSLRGEWQGVGAGASARPFSAQPLAPSGRDGTPRIVRKRLDENKPFSDPKRAVAGGKRCEVRFQYPELVAVLAFDVEERVNAKLVPRVTDSGDLCADMEYASSRYDVTAAERGIVSVCSWVEWMGLGAAHPGSGVECTTVALPGGDILTEKSLFRPSVRARIKAAVPEKPDVGDLVKQAFDDANLDFSVSPRGVSFFAYNALPHAMQGAGAEPIVLPYAKIKGDMIHPNPLDAYFESK